MERNEVMQRITQIKASADQIVQACEADSKVPQTLKQSIGALDAELNNALETVEQSDDEESIAQCIDDLEESADQAKKEAQRASGINENTRNLVLRTHDEISELKHQLH